MKAIPAVMYAILMAVAYGSQIYHLYKTEKTEGLSAWYYINGLIAVLLRAFTQGLVILDTKHIAAIALGLAEIVVILGLATITIQFWWYKHKIKKRRLE